MILASRYIVAFAMIWCLSKRVVLLPPKLGGLQFGGYLKSGDLCMLVKVVNIIIVKFL